MGPEAASPGSLLAGIKIVDLSSGLAGPFATRLLAEFGADVVKVEPPGGDPTRVTAPAGFASWNRSKTSVTIDLDDTVDRERLESLLEGADVLVHDLTQGGATAWGLDDEALRQRHRHLVVSSVTAYPVGHADAERFGTELLVQARSGAMDEQEGLRPGPIAIRMPFASWGAGYLLAGGIAVRLFARERQGVAEPIHTSLMQGALVPASLYWQRAERPPEWMTTHTLPKLNTPPHLSIFRCEDGRWLQVLGGFTKSAPMVAFLDEIGCAHLAGERCLPENQHEWAEVFARRTLDEWTRDLWATDVPCMPVLDLGEVLATDQARLNGYAVEVDDPVFGATWQAGHPSRRNHLPEFALVRRRWVRRGRCHSPGASHAAPLQGPSPGILRGHLRACTSWTSAPTWPGPWVLSASPTSAPR